MTCKEEREGSTDKNNFAKLPKVFANCARAGRFHIQDVEAQWANRELGD